MLKLAAIVGAITSCSMVVGACAEEMSTFANTNTQDGATTKDIHFEFASCGGECQVATLSCSESGAISLQLADVDAKHAAKAIVQQENQVLVSAGQLRIGYDISEMRFQEMNGSWWVSAYNNHVDGAKLAGAIAGAKLVVAKIGGQTVSLPVDANVKAWAKACK